MRYPAWIDGELLPAGQGRVSCDDQGFQLGLAVFETILYERGCAYFVEQHLERLARSARALAIAWPPPWDPAQSLASYGAALGEHDVALRITLTRGVPSEGPTLVIGARDLVRPPEQGVVVVLERDAKRARDELESVKSTNRVRNVLARETALRQGAYEALLCTDEGDVSEGTLSNVFAVVDGTVWTPSTDRGCLSGIMRGELCRLAAQAGRQVRVERLELEDLARASEIFLSNTTGRVIPVLEVRDLVGELPGARGEVARELRERLRAHEELYRSARAVR